MSEPLAVVIDGERVLHYDRGQPLPEAQRAYLDRMDRQMDAGFELWGERIEVPDRRQRATFVAGQLIQALASGDDALAAAATSYLALRYPGLKQVRADFEGESYTVQLIYDRPYEEGRGLRFVDPPAPPGRN